MRHSLESLKNNLKDITPMIEKLSSEAVQLRVLDIVERLLSADLPTPTLRNDNAPRRLGRPPGSGRGKKTVRAAKAAKTAQSTPRAGRRKRRGVYGEGPSLVLNTLMDQGFFSKARSIADIIEIAERQYGRVYKQPELSGRLLKLTQLKKLKRSKNSQGRFVYQGR